jgi:hypothetical protein
MPVAKCSATTPSIPAISTDILLSAYNQHVCTQDTVLDNKGRVSSVDGGMWQRDDSMLEIGSFCGALPHRLLLAPLDQLQVSAPSFEARQTRANAITASL